MELILRRQKTPIFLYLFQDLNNIIMRYKFRGVIILEGQYYGAKKVNKRRPGGQEGGSHAAPVPCRVGPPQSALVASIASNLRT